MHLKFLVRAVFIQWTVLLMSILLNNKLPFLQPAINNHLIRGLLSNWTGRYWWVEPLCYRDLHRFCVTLCNSFRVVPWIQALSLDSTEDGMLTFSKISFPWASYLCNSLVWIQIWKLKFWNFTLASRRNSPKARAAGMFFAISKDKNAYVGLSSHPKQKRNTLWSWKHWNSQLRSSVNVTRPLNLAEYSVFTGLVIGDVGFVFGLRFESSWRSLLRFCYIYF